MSHTTKTSVSHDFIPGEYDIGERALQIPWSLKNQLLGKTATIMIGGESRDDPFYPPEVVALAIARLIALGSTVEVRIYSIAALRFTGATDGEYYPENEQIERIRDCLEKLDMPSNWQKHVTFLPSQEDNDAQHIARELQSTVHDHRLQAMLDLYKKDKIFQKDIQKAVPQNQRERPEAYKYVLFEILVILKQCKEGIKVGDMREKKYDALIHKYFLNPEGALHEHVWSLSDLQSIYWDKRWLAESYQKYQLARDNAEYKREMQRMSKKILHFKRIVWWAVAAVLTLPSVWYYAGKIRTLSDPSYRLMVAWQEKDEELYLSFHRDLNTLWNPYGHIVDHTTSISLRSKLLHEGISPNLENGNKNPDFYKKVGENRSRYIRQVCEEICQPIRIFWSGRDLRRLQVYEGMIHDLAESYILHEAFPDYASYKKAVQESPLLDTAKNYLIQPLTGTVWEMGSDNWWQRIQELYRVQAQGFRQDDEQWRLYRVSYDQFGQSISWPDADIPLGRETLLHYCEALVSGKTRYTYFDINMDDIRKSQALYYALLPVFEKYRWRNFYYTGIAKEILSTNTEIGNILVIFGYSPDAIVSPRTQSYVRSCYNGELWWYIISEFPGKEREMSQKMYEDRDDWLRRVNEMQRYWFMTPWEAAKYLERMSAQYD